MLQAAADQAVLPWLEGNLHSKMAQPSLYHHILTPQRDRPQTASHSGHNFPTSLLIFCVCTTEASQKHLNYQILETKTQIIPFCNALAAASSKKGAPNDTFCKKYPNFYF